MKLYYRLSEIKQFIHSLKSKYNISYSFILLLFFLLAIIIISFIVPLFEFGRLFGTDDYTHLFHTREMSQANGLSDFYDNMGGIVSDPSSEANLFNYPFGLWLFGATIIKITGLSSAYAGLALISIYLFVLIGSFFLYSGLFLHSNEQKIIAALFLISMPNFALTILAYRPSIFVLPFLFIALYFTFREPIEWKLIPVLWFSIFLIIIAHTGTFMFLITLSILFFLLYCLFWGIFSKTTYFLILSSFIIYIITLGWFPEIANQYEVKTDYSSQQVISLRRN